jgi:autotransporter family porin
VPFQSNLNGTWGEINVGVSGQLDRKTTLFANLSYNERFDGKGQGYNGKIGIRMNW